MSAESLRASTLDVLGSWCPTKASDESLRQTMLAFAGSASRGCLREHAAGHFTASAVVLDAARRNVVLTLHPRVGRWLQVGGHCEESDETVLDAALREATEESGIADLRLDPVLLSAQTHAITCSLGVPTRHLDLRFLVHAPVGAQIVRSSESDDLRWWPVDRLPETAERDTITELVELALQR